MKFRDKIGDESVQELIREACERAQQLPHEDFRDPWPDRRSFVIEATPVRLDDIPERVPGGSEDEDG